MSVAYDTRATVRDLRLIARCPKCKVAVSRLIRRTITRTYRSDQVGEISRRVTDSPANAPSAILCCGYRVPFALVHGTTNSSIVCSAKCSASKGHVCECSCGGQNHGAAYESREVSQ